MFKDPYQKTARFYDRFVEPVNAQVRQIALRMHPPQPGMRVLDVGCGTGTNLDLYRKNQCQVSGIDSSPAMIHEAKTKLGTEVDIRLGDASRMPYADSSFDLVVSMLTLHEISKGIRSQVLEEMRRVLKPSGRLLLIDFHPGPLRFPKGWIMKCLILFFEIVAGREHFKNYRHFLTNGGLPGLMRENGQLVEKKKILSGGNLGMYLIRDEIASKRYQMLKHHFSTTAYQTLQLP